MFSYGFMQSLSSYISANTLLSWLQYLHPFHRLALISLIVPGDLWKEPSMAVDEVFQTDVSSEDS